MGLVQLLLTFKLSDARSYPYNAKWCFSAFTSKSRSSRLSSKTYMTSNVARKYQTMSLVTDKSVCEMSGKCRTVQQCERLILILPNALVLSTCAVPIAFALVDHVRDPATHTISILSLGRRPAVLEIRWVNVEARDSSLGGEAWGSALGATTTAAAAHERFNLCSLLRRGCLRCGISEQRVHVFKTDVGSLRIDEVD